jgi:hypothetical protein
MGMWFSSIHVQNRKQVKAKQFVKTLSAYMENKGLVPVPEDVALHSYSFAFSKSNNWVVLREPTQELGEKAAAEVAQDLAAALKANCILANVAASDMVTLDLFDESGGKTDMVVLGRPDYGFEEVVLGKRELWEPLLASGNTWEQLHEVWSADETFAENILYKTESLLGIDSYDEDSGLQEITVHFAKEEAENALSFTGAFKQVFGEALEPLGFKLIKSKHPYYVRLVNDEVIHALSCCSEATMQIGQKAFNIITRVASIYQRDIRFTGRPHYWFGQIGWYYNMRKYLKFEEKDQIFLAKMDRFHYEPTDSEMLLSQMKFSLEATKRVMFPIFDEVYDLDTFIDYNYKFDATNTGVYDLDETIEGIRPAGWLMLLKTDNYAARIENSLRRNLDMYEYTLKLHGYGTQEELERRWQNFEETKKRLIAPIEAVLNNPESNAKAMAELEKYKAKNIKKFKSIGLMKQQNMSLNAAFKQVFGEALEPLGFVKVKGRQPYFVRMVGDEIIHVVSCIGAPPLSGQKDFDVLCGVATVYRPYISLNLCPRTNQNWLEYLTSLHEFHYESGKRMLGFRYNEETLAKKLKYASDKTIEIILPILDKVTDIESCIEYFHKYKTALVMTLNYDIEDLSKKSGNCDYNEGLLYVKSNNYDAFIRRMDKFFAEVAKYGETEIKNTAEALSPQKAFIEEVYNNAESHNKVLAELERRKTENIKILKSYGLEIKQQ